jgi:multisubunit Na+/H+ antiporter MnhB subunit
MRPARQPPKAPRHQRTFPLHRSSTRVLSILMIVIGVALLVRTAAAGGGALATGVLLGVLFVLAGAARLYLQSRG